MNKKELLDGIKDDLEITPENVQDKLYKIPSLHSKYLGLYFNTKNKLNKKEKELAILFKTKYNMFKEGDEILDKKEILFHVMADEEYANLNCEVQSITDLVDVLDRTVKKVNTLSFDVKNLIDYLQYISGV